MKTFVKDLCNELSELITERTVSIFTAGRIGTPNAKDAIESWSLMSRKPFELSLSISKNRKVTKPMVEYGPAEDKLNSFAPAMETVWTAAPQDHIRYTYRTRLLGLLPGQKYYYSVGGTEANSSIFSFKAIPDDPYHVFKIAIFGDFSIKHGFSMDPLLTASANGEFDMVFHIGDIAYDLDKDDGKTGDEFLDTIQPLTSSLPYMVIAGNHEVNNNFSHFSNRFTMPSNGVIKDNQFWRGRMHETRVRVQELLNHCKTKRLHPNHLIREIVYYRSGDPAPKPLFHAYGLSIDVGHTHFVGISSEYYGFNISDLAVKQSEWLQNDLQRVNAFNINVPRVVGRAKLSAMNWVQMRNGAPGFPSLEEIFFNYKIDMVFWGHKHGYERLYPIYKSKFFKMSDTQNFHNSPTPVYTLTGAAAFSAVQLFEYGYTVLSLDSPNMARSWFVNAKNSNELLDYFTLTKDENKEKTENHLLLSRGSGSFN